jgi:alpha-ketoglutarate-dependent taurine dioxygenase
MKGLKERWLNSQQLPLVVEPLDTNISAAEGFSLIAANRSELEAKLLKVGGILFRNFPLHDEHGFASFIKVIDNGSFLDYIGGDSPRNKITEGIYTSTEAPPGIKIPLHNELSFVKNYPKRIYFFCQIAPNSKGETTIADARKVHAAIDHEVRSKFIAQGLKYISCYYYKSWLMNLLNKWQRSHKSWIDVFESEQPQIVEKKCIESEFGFKWQQHQWLQISQERPAVIDHPITQEKVWFNQAHLYDFNPKLLGLWRYLGAKLLYMRKHMRLHEVFFADGSTIPRHDLYHILDALEANTIYFPWQKGDLMMLDNVLTMHGRATFSGKRRVLTAMTG